MNTTDQETRARRFRELHDSGHFVIANCWDAGSARVLASLGFAALATSSSAAAAVYGRLDHGISIEQCLENARAICQATDLPVSADLEKGFGDQPADVMRAIQRAAEVGLVGGSIEDASGARDKPIYDLNFAIDRVAAAVEAARVARAYTEIRATFAGRAGAISVREGSLVQPGSNPLVTITQIDPIAVSFTIPEKELPALQTALAAGKVSVVASVKEATVPPFKGIVTFVDNTVDPTSGTIKVKAEFANSQAQLWPGMYVNVEVSPRTLRNATVVPAQAVQTGPENRFVYIVGADGKVSQRTVSLVYVDSGTAVIDGLDPGARIVVEGAQNLRPGSAVQEAQREGAPPKGGGESRKGKKAA